MICFIKHDWILQREPLGRGRRRVFQTETLIFEVNWRVSIDRQKTRVCVCVHVCGCVYGDCIDRALMTLNTYLEMRNP